MSEEILFDIVPPAAPLVPTESASLLPLFVLLAGLAVAALLVWRRLRWRVRLRRAVELPGPDAAYAVADLLRRRWGLLRLDPAQPPHPKRADEWASLVRQLERLRYAPCADGSLPLSLLRLWL